MLKRIYDNKLAIFLFVLIVICTCIGLSYAYWKITMVQNNSNLVTSDCFSLEFTDENDITLQNAYPMYDEELINFMMEATPYHFTVTNKCNREMYYTINLESLLLENGVKKLPDRYMDIVLFDGNSSFKEFYEAFNSSESEEERQSLYENFFVRPTLLDMQMYGAFFSINLSNLDINEEKVLPNAETAYIMKEEKIGANESKSYNLLLLMNYDTPAMEETMNATWEGKVTITSTYDYNPQKAYQQMMRPVCSGGTQSIDTYTIKCSDNTQLENSFRTSGYNIQTIVFQNEMNPPSNYVVEYDESMLQNGSVKSYIVKDENLAENEETYTVYIQSSGKLYLPPDSALFFAGSNIKKIEGLENLDISFVLDMSNMFANVNLSELDLSMWDIPRNAGMFFMFYNANISTMNLSTWQLPAKVGIGSIFYGLETTSLNLSHWDVSSLANISSLFSGLKLSTE